MHTYRNGDRFIARLFAVAHTDKTGLPWIPLSRLSATAAILVGLLVMPSAGQRAAFAQERKPPAPVKAHPAPVPGAAVASEHGGASFASEDKRHHIEGVLLPGAKFRLYVYGADLKPVSAAELKQTAATLQWGSSELATRTALAPVADGAALEAVSGADVKLPITLTLRIIFAGMARGAKPELFTLLFTQFSAPAEDLSAKPPDEAIPPSHMPPERPMPPTDRSADTLEHRPGR